MPGIIKNPDQSVLAFISDYLPRQCGIATFAYDLCESVAQEAGAESDVFVVAVNDTPEGYPYSDRVRFEIRQTTQADFRLAAEYLNINQASAVCLQHEYGLFGGVCGSNILALLRRIRRPLVTTLHTVLKDPTDQQHIVLSEISRLSDRLVVMSDMAHEILNDVYDVPREKIVTIPHGIPDIPFVDPNFYKDQFGVEGKEVLLTFGLLSPGKGLEYVIEALPEVVQKHPNVVYIILGATHPHVKRESGEEYRNSLIRRVHDLGLSENVIFQNRFVEKQELCEFLGAADIYVTPYLNEAQITSGTLAYALGAGKATVSTPYWYAEEMLSDGRGRLVPFKDPSAIAEQVIDLLDNPTARHAMRKKAYNFTRRMVWPQVAGQYLELFEQAREAWLEKRRGVAVPETIPEQPDELPEVDLRHLHMLTDDTGILRHCMYSTPDHRYGYCTEDNARALIVTAMYWDQTHDESILRLMQTYLSFVAHACDEKSGRYRNYMRYDRHFGEEVGSEESHGRALWGLGMAVAFCPYESMIALATRLFVKGLPVTESFKSPRAWAYTLVGIQAYLKRFSGDSEVRRYRSVLSEQLSKHFCDNMSDDWPWCEDEVTYSNGKLPHALLMCGKWLQRDDLIDLGKKTLTWLMEIQTGPEGYLSLIGNRGWCTKDGKRSRFDQLPIEAHCLLDACVEAYRVTREERWISEARKAFNWFLGDNDLRAPLYDFTTGGCRDGLAQDRVNENQGAESTLAWLLSLLTMHDLQMERTLGRIPADKDIEEKPVPPPIKPSGPIAGVDSAAGEPAGSAAQGNISENASPDSND